MLEKLAEAADRQEGLLDEFAQVADELQRILNNLEGSTFVKRLKAASRRQLEVVRDLSHSLPRTFGVGASQIPPRGHEHASQLAARQVVHSDDVRFIQSDLRAYFQRVRQQKFESVLSEMEETHVVGELREIARTVKDLRNGESVVVAEFWADTLDRWAEELVGPG
jgi:hypothetical protein